MSDFFKPYKISDNIPEGFVEPNIQENNPRFADIMFGDDGNDSYSLSFDGKRLSLMKGDKEINHWNGVSGAEGYQSPEYQNLKDQDPIPEGNYEVRQSQYVPMGLSDAILGIVGRGKFPGSIISWGSGKISLLPMNENKTQGRDNFAIHGGFFPGSRGCIDLTGQNEDFMRMFKALGKDLVLTVKYPQPKEGKRK